MSGLWILAIIVIIVLFVLWLRGGANNSIDQRQSKGRVKGKQKGNASTGGGGVPWMKIFLGGALLAGGTYLAVKWNEIQRWFDANRVSNSIGELIRTAYQNGEYNLVGNIRSKDSGAVIRTNTWPSGKMDDSLKQRFGNSDRIVIYE